MTVQHYGLGLKIVSNTATKVPLLKMLLLMELLIIINSQIANGI